MIRPFPKPRPFPRPKTPRLPDRKAMTIVAGFRCHDGLVLCADTEHSDGFSKFQRRKIRSFVDQDCVIRFAGAGHSDYIDMTTEKIMSRLPAKGKSIQAIKDSFEEVVLDIQTHHIQPFFDMHDQYRPQVRLLAIIRLTTGELELIKVSDTTVSTVEDYDVLGSGEHLARSLVDWLYDPMTPTRLMRVVALNIVQQTKRYVSGVGGTTHVASLTSDVQRRQAGLYDDSEFFFGIQKYLRPLLLASIDEKAEDTEFTKHRDKLIELLNDVRSATNRKQDAENYFFKRSTSEKSEPER
jgi:hypothetical protein